MTKQISLLLLPLAALLGQTPAPKPATPKPAASKPVTRAKPAPPAPAATPKPDQAPVDMPAAAAPAVPDTSQMAPDTVILTVGTEKLTKAEWEKFLSVLPARLAQEASGPNRRKVAEQLVEVKALAQEAQKRKMDQSPKLITQLNLQRENLLAQALYSELMNSVTMDDASAQKYYEDHKSDYESITARHILIRVKGSKIPVKEGQQELTEQEALAKVLEIRRQILAGSKFEELAKTSSDDTMTGANGGSLGTFSHGQMVPEFEKAAFALPAGQVSEPVKSAFGYHLILVDEKKAKSFDEAKPDIEQHLKPELARKAVEGIRNSSGAVINDQYFGK